MKLKRLFSVFVLVLCVQFCFTESGDVVLTRTEYDRIMTSLENSQKALQTMKVESKKESDRQNQELQKLSESLRLQEKEKLKNNILWGIGGALVGSIMVKVFTK